MIPFCKACREGTHKTRDRGMSVLNPHDALKRLLADREDLDACIEIVQAEIEELDAK